MDSNLKIKSASSLRWSSFGSILPKIINPVISLSLINLVDPKEYGLLAIINYIINFINILNGFGLFEYILKEKQLCNLKLNSLFWLNIILSFTIFILILTFSPLISAFYKQPQLTNLLFLSSIVLVLNSMQLINMSLLLKFMEYKKIFLLQIFPTLTLFLLTYPLARMGYGVWSFVISQLLTSLLSMILYFKFTDWRPQFIFSKIFALDGLKFGRWVTLEKVIEFIYSNIDLFFVSIFFDIQITGIYSIARGLATVLFTTVNGPFGQIMLPLLSKLQFQNIGIVFLKISSRIYFINVSIIIFVVIFSDNFLPFIFTNKNELIKILPIVVLSEGLSRCIWIQRDIYKIQNMPKKYLVGLFPNLIYIIAILLFFKPSNLVFFALIKLSNDLLYYIIQNYIFIKFSKISFTSIFKLFSKLVLSGFCTYLIYHFVNIYKYLGINLLLSLTSIFISIIIYIFFIFIFDRLAFQNYKTDLILFFNLKR